MMKSGSLYPILPLQKPRGGFSPRVFLRKCIYFRREVRQRSFSARQRTARKAPPVIRRPLVGHRLFYPPFPGHLCP